MNRIEYHADNGHAPWVCRIGKGSHLWFAYPTLFKAILKFPVLAWKMRNCG